MNSWLEVLFFLLWLWPWQIFGIMALLIAGWICVWWGLRAALNRDAPAISITQCTGAPPAGTWKAIEDQGKSTELDALAPEEGK